MYFRRNTRRSTDIDNDNSDILKSICFPASIFCTIFREKMSSRLKEIVTKKIKIYFAIIFFTYNIT